MQYLVAFLLFLGVTADRAIAAQETIQGHIKIMQPWVHETDASEVVLHLAIANTGARADRLLRVATPVALNGTISAPQRTEVDRLIIPGHAELVFGAGTPSIKLRGLKHPLKANERFGLLLVFEQAGKVACDVHVVPAPR